MSTTEAAPAVANLGEAGDVLEATRTPSTGQARPELTLAQCVRLWRQLEGLAMLEHERLPRVAALGLTAVTAHELGLRQAVRDALIKLTNNCYGRCEQCSTPISFDRLKAIPYARRCLRCQQRWEDAWDPIERLVGGVVHAHAGEPQGPSAISQPERRT
jgi:hypothetical protein